MSILTSSMWKTLNDEDKASYSILTHENPERLLQKAAGKGIPAKGGDPKEVGYKESYDFNEVIGIWKSEGGSISKPTTRGMLHYDTSGGAHIVPIKPNGEP